VFLDIINPAFLFKTQRFGDWILSPSSGRNLLYLSMALAIAQAVSRWFPTAAARVPVWVWQEGFVVDKVDLGQIFSEYFGFLSQSSFHQILHHHNHPGQVH
jgi:hypothetical protein